MIGRRSLITGLVAFVAAPAIVRASSLMPVRAVEIDWERWRPEMFELLRARLAEAYAVMGRNLAENLYGPATADYGFDIVGGLARHSAGYVIDAGPGV